jgi:hypothetical protein
MQILVWINCYGAWDPAVRSPVETIGYSQYLDGVAQAVVGLGLGVEKIYFSGGMRDAQNRTECATTIPELRRRLYLSEYPAFVPEADEESLTSITIVRTFLRTWKEHYSHTAPILFCDEVRYEVNAYTLEKLAEEMGTTLPPINQVLIPIPRLDIHPNSTDEKQAQRLTAMKERGIDQVEQEEITARIIN